MSKLKDLQERLGEKKTELRALLALTEGDTARSLNEDEQKRMKAINSDVDDLARQIDEEENIERARKNAAIDKANRESEEQKLERKFSISRTVQIKMGNEKFDGAEKEMHDECAKEARAIGLPIKGGILYKRQAVTTDAAAAGNMIPTTLGPKEMGYAKVGFDSLGIRKITGLVGVNNIPVEDLLAESAYVGQAAAHTNVDVATRLSTLSAKALRTKIGASWLMHAMGQEIDSLLTNALEAAKINTINKTLITGAGSSTVPVGILSAAGVTDVTGANGEALTFAKLLEMLNAPEANDASFVSPAWASSPQVRQYLSNLKVDAGSGIMAWPHTMPNNLLGFTAAVSTHLPVNLTKGSGTNLKALVYGHWDQMIHAEWAIKEMIEDKLTDETGPKLIEICFNDNAVLNPKAFAKGYFTTP